MGDYGRSDSQSRMQLEYVYSIKTCMIQNKSKQTRHIDTNHVTVTENQIIIIVYYILYR